MPRIYIILKNEGRFETYKVVNDKPIPISTLIDPSNIDENGSVFIIKGKVYQFRQRKDEETNLCCRCPLDSSWNELNCTGVVDCMADNFLKEIPSNGMEFLLAIESRLRTSKEITIFGYNLE